LLLEVSPARILTDGCGRTRLTQGFYIGRPAPIESNGAVIGRNPTPALKLVSRWTRSGQFALQLSDAPSIRAARH
jgi:hypothetical protein